MNQVTHIVSTNADLHALDLSFYSLSKLADALRCVDPRTCLEQRLERADVNGSGAVGVLVLDDLGNYISFDVSVNDYDALADAPGFQDFAPQYR